MDRGASIDSSNDSGGRIPRQASRQHRLSGARRPDHQQVMAPAAATSRRGAQTPAMEIGQIGDRLHVQRHRWRVREVPQALPATRRPID
jgi:hypothetical protein